MLKQPQYSPLAVENQVLLLYMLTRRYFSSVRVEDVMKTADDYLRFMGEYHKDIADEIREKKEVSNELEGKIKASAEEFVKRLPKS
jgi:F-type H+-transporting ATPase subunit alpha